MPFERRVHELTTEAACARLDSESFAEAVSAGRELSLEDAVAYGRETAALASGSVEPVAPKLPAPK